MRKARRQLIFNPLGDQLDKLVGRARLESPFGNWDHRSVIEPCWLESREGRALAGATYPHHSLGEVQIGELATR